ncbi:MAG: hypothetical protein ABF254_00005 [Octadecabacter sp.]
MTPRCALRHPFHTRPLSGAQVGWFRPAAAVLIALLIPVLLAMTYLYTGSPTLLGPPEDGTGYTLRDHIDIVTACLAASVVVSWVIAPIALLVLRASAMLGWAGWGSAVLCALTFGLPAVHLTLNGDVTTESQAILPHIVIAIALLGLSVWAAFWGLIALNSKSPNNSST